MSGNAVLPLSSATSLPGGDPTGQAALDAKAAADATINSSSRDTLAAASMPASSTSGPVTTPPSSVFDVFVSVVKEAIRTGQAAGGTNNFRRHQFAQKLRERLHHTPPEFNMQEAIKWFDALGLADYVEVAPRPYGAAGPVFLRTKGLPDFSDIVPPLSPEAKQVFLGLVRDATAVFGGRDKAVDVEELHNLLADAVSEGSPVKDTFKGKQWLWWWLEHPEIKGELSIYTDERTKKLLVRVRVLAPPKPKESSSSAPVADAQAGEAADVAAGSPASNAPQTVGEPTSMALLLMLQRAVRKAASKGYVYSDDRCDAERLAKTLRKSAPMLPPVTPAGPGLHDAELPTWFASVGLASEVEFCGHLMRFGPSLLRVKHMPEIRVHNNTAREREMLLRFVEKAAPPGAAFVSASHLQKRLNAQDAQGVPQIRNFWWWMHDGRVRRCFEEWVSNGELHVRPRRRKEVTLEQFVEDPTAAIATAPSDLRDRDGWVNVGVPSFQFDSLLPTEPKQSSLPVQPKQSTTSAAAPTTVAKQARPAPAINLAIATAKRTVPATMQARPSEKATPAFAQTSPTEESTPAVKPVRRSRRLQPELPPAKDPVVATLVRFDTAAAATTTSTTDAVLPEGANGSATATVVEMNDDDKVVLEAPPTQPTTPPSEAAGSNYTLAFPRDFLEAAVRHTVASGFVASTGHLQAVALAEALRKVEPRLPPFVEDSIDTWFANIGLGPAIHFAGRLFGDRGPLLISIIVPDLLEISRPEATDEGRRAFLRLLLSALSSPYNSPFIVDRQYIDVQRLQRLLRDPRTAGSDHSNHAIHDPLFWATDEEAKEFIELKWFDDGRSYLRPLPHASLAAGPVGLSTRPAPDPQPLPSSLELAARQAIADGFCYSNGCLDAVDVAVKFWGPDFRPVKARDLPNWFFRVGLADHVEFQGRLFGDLGPQLLTVKGLSDVRKPDITDQARLAFLGAMQSALEMPTESSMVVRDGGWMAASHVKQALLASHDPLLGVKNAYYWIDDEDIRKHVELEWEFRQPFLRLAPSAIALLAETGSNRHEPSNIMRVELPWTD